MEQEMIFGGVVKGKQRNSPSDGGQEHYYRVTGIDVATSRPVSYDVAASVPVADLADGKAPATGSKVRVVLNAYAQRVKKFRQDGSEYVSQAYDLIAHAWKVAA